MGIGRTVPGELGPKCTVHGGAYGAGEDRKGLVRRLPF
jgi:hypothetical protein